MASTHLTFTNGTPTNNAKFTISVWSKRSGLASSDYLNIMNSRQTSSTSGLGLWWGNDSFYYNFGTGTTGTAYCQSNAKYRDVNGWYHMVVAGDTTQSGTDKLKFWINGEQITSFSNDERSSFVGLDYDIGNTNYPILIGMKHDGTYYYDGLLSHLHFIDGTAYQASDFGSTDSTTGEWKINVAPSVTYGNNGFFILKDGNSVTDQSGNGNNFTVGGGTLTKTEDCPSNIFATMNPLGTYDGTLSNGNTRVKTNQTNYRYIASTLGVSSGRYYWECKLQEIGNYMLSGITDQPSFPASGVVMLGNGTYDCAIYIGDQSEAGGNGHLYHSSTSNSNSTNTPGQFMAGFSQGDILTFALDLDSATKKLYIGANGSWANGSGATNQTFANATGVSIVTPANTNTGFYFPACGDYSGTYGHWEYNFGNGYFGTTAISSAGTNASNIGIFEYDVPSGYTALSTKGLNSF